MTSLWKWLFPGVAVGLVALLCMGGCSSSGEGGECVDDSDCERPLVCIGGLCEEPGTGGTGGMGGAGGSGGMGGSGGSAGMAGTGGMTGDPFADEVDDSLTDINNAGCLGNCVGDPVNALGAPDFVEGQGGFTNATLGPGGTLGLIFVDQPCFVDNDPTTPDILVYEQGGVQVEDFFVDAVPPGGQNLTGTPARSTATVNLPERRLDLTDVIGGAGMVQRIQIIDIVADGDEVETGGGGFEAGWGADIDAVECLSQQ